MISLSGVCVDDVVICDNTNDCGDESDELACELYEPVCTFEDGQPCYWTQELEQDDIGEFSSGHGTRLFMRGLHVYIHPRMT